ncbi:MAG: hypothetical protein HY897_18770 [Deltaproteobacteria bacterium]|nr:hypothetical protein [Deltaproteobacteria bacterium]
MAQDGGKATFGQKLKRAFGFGKGAAAPAKNARRGVRFRLMYERFREILALNDAVLHLIADIEDKLMGREAFALDPMVQRIRRTAMDVFVMAKDLNQIADNRYPELYEALRRVTADIDLECASERRVDLGPLVIPISKLRAPDAGVAGAKMANLGEVQGALGLRVPDGFVITAAAFARFMSRNYLTERVAQLEGTLEMFGSRTLAEACREVQTAIRQAEIPPDLENAMMGAYDSLAGGKDALVSMRSSAAGEDSVASHAGLYYTELNVSRDLLLDTYTMIVASAYSPGAVSYRIERGLTEWEATMAVGCMRMLEPRCSGIMFSRSFREMGADRVSISVTPGVSAWVASGRQGAEEITVAPGELSALNSSLLGTADLERLVDAARRLEAHFGSPQDVEWAIDRDGELHILQTRPMIAAPATAGDAACVEPEDAPLLSGGYTACPGAGAGPVFPVRGDDDLEWFPKGAVLVARHSSPTFSRLMGSCAAIITDVGSPTGHMAILAREFGVPAVVGLDGATRTLEKGRVVTVNATTCKVYSGEIAGLVCGAEERAPLAGSPAVKRLQCVARHVTPLNLINPQSRDFAPGNCKTIHDITRFIHEKVYQAMFRIGDMAAQHNPGAFMLETDLPVVIRLFDLGGGVADGAEDSGPLKTDRVVSVPMVSFLEGLLDKRIRWHQPRPVSMRGFLSVLGEGVAGPPPEARGVGSVSYAVVSDRYMNFSTKAGYHFSTVDVYCGQSQNKNYIHFQFAGGGAGEERRMRRVKFLSEVLSNLDFRIQLRGDRLVARLEKYDNDYIRTKLVDLGRLTMCSRQLDMLMDSEESPGFFAKLFLEGQLERF